MLSNTMKRLNRTNRLITVDDISDNLLAGRSAAHTACWKYLQLASYDSALEHANTICLREPDKPDGFVFKARALFQLKRFNEAEEVLIHVMRIAEQNKLIRSDVEGMVKLKDELANSRVEILRIHNFRDPIDIAEMHWNDCKQPILELIGFASKHKTSTPMEVDCEIIDIIGAEKAKQLYGSDLNIDSSPKHKSTPNSANGLENFSTFSKRRTNSHSNLDISGEFPIRDRNRDRAEERNTSANFNDSELNDVQLRNAGLKTALLLAEEKSQNSERKCRELEEELKKVYQHLLKLSDEKKSLEKKCDTLEQQLDKVVSQSHRQSELEILEQRAPPPRQTPKKSPKQRERVFTNSNRSSDRFHAKKPYGLQRGGEFTARVNTGLLPPPDYSNYRQMPPINPPMNRRYPPGILPMPPPQYGRGDYQDIQFKYSHNY